LVTILLGEAYIAEWETYVRPSWQKYAERHGYDLFVMTEPILPGAITATKSAHWQKLLVPSLPALRDHDFVVWLDADVLINHRVAPCVCGQMTTQGIGAVDMAYVHEDAADGFSVAWRYSYLMKLAAQRAVEAGLQPILESPTEGFFSSTEVPRDESTESHYREHGIENPPRGYLNTGLLVTRPGRHAEMLAEIFARYDHDSDSFEQTYVSYELLKAGAVELLDRRFNALWAYELARNYPFLFRRFVEEGADEVMAACVNTAFANNYFLHFAGGNSVVKRAMRLVDIDAAKGFEVAFPETRGGAGAGSEGGEG